MTEDTQLKEIGYYTGTMQYHNVMGFNVTDGIGYVMENGYSWFITDVLAIIKTDATIRNEEFLSVKLKLDGDKGQMIIDDGNGNVLYKQDYEYTDAKKELKLFFTNGVLMLAGEY